MSASDIKDQNYYIYSSLKDVRKSLDSNSKHLIAKTRYLNHEELYKSGNSETFNNVIARTNKIETQIQRNKSTEAIIGSQIQSLLGIGEIIKDARSELQLSSTLYNVDFSSVMTQALKNVGRELNSVDNNMFIFGGADKSKAPIDENNFVEENNIVGDKFTRNYTQVLEQDENFIIGFNRSLNVSTDAADPAFRQVIGALHMAKNLNENSTEQDKIDVMRELDESFDKIANLHAKLSKDQEFLGRQNSIFEQQKIKIASFIQENIQSDPMEYRNNYDQLVSDLTSIMKIFASRDKLELQNYVNPQ